MSSRRDGEREAKAFRAAKPKALPAGAGMERVTLEQSDTRADTERSAINESPEALPT